MIGVVLAGLALGNWLGGRIADTRPGRTTLSALYLGGAAGTALILFFARDVERVHGAHLAGRRSSRCCGSPG